MINLRKTQTFIRALRPWRPEQGVLWMVALLVLGVSTAQAQVSGISYTVSPIGQRVYWDGDAALDDGFFYGGALGFGFGEYVELSALYLFGTNFDTNFSDFSGDSLGTLAALPSRNVDIQRYGGRLRFNVGSGRVAPFVMLGTGIIQFDPEDLEKTESIYAEAGVGLTFSVASRYTLSLAAQGLAYRYNPSTAFLSDQDLAQAGMAREDFEQQEVFNPTLSASLKFYLGGRAQDELTDVDRAFISQFRGGNFRLAVEPFYGQINFNDELGFPEEQRVVGVNAGFDLGPYLGLRGFYWKGADKDDPTDFQDITFYGGELTFRFQRELGGSITPYLNFGGGYADIDSDKYAEETGFGPESRYFALAGGGVEVPLSSAVKLQAGVRSMLMSKEDVEDVSEPGSIHNSFMYTAGINFNLGGSGRTAGTVMGRELEATRTEARDRNAAVERQLALIQARLDSLQVEQSLTSQEVEQMIAAAMDAYDRTGYDSTGAPVWSAAMPPRLVMQRDTVFIQESGRSNLSGQTLTIPVPEEGEIYVRFGPAPQASPEAAYAPPMIFGMTPQMTTVPAAAPATIPPTATIPVYTDSTMAGGLTLEQIRQIVRQAVAEQQPQQQGLTAEQLDASLRQMETRIERRIARESNRLRDEIDDQPRPAQTTTAPDSTRSGGLLSGLGQRELVAVMPLVGLRTGNGPTQFLLGVRADYRFAGKGFRFLPEVAIGIGDNVAFNAFGNLAWSFGSIGALRPYAGPGIGFISDSGLSNLELAFNLLAGAEYTTLGGATFFGELSSLDFFDVNRLIVGYRLRF